ncbi:MAG: HAD-IIB family hydrolase [Phycisphaerales bacterium]
MSQREVETPHQGRTGTPAYDVLAIDLDGTLLDSRGRVSEANVGAIERARKAGVLVTICTGRGLVECLGALERIRQEEHVVVAGGSIIACPVERRTRERFGLPTDVARGVTTRIVDHGHAALVLKDPLETGYDYLVVTGRGGERLDPTTRWWFDEHRIQYREVRRVEDDEHPEHTVRVGACSYASRLMPLERAIHGEFGGETVMHNFPAVVREEEDGESTHILEVFHSKANKWDAVCALAKRRGRDVARICAIGDQVNDVVLLKNAALGIAMGNGVEEAKRAAKRMTKSNNEDGVAAAVEMVLSGAW